MDMQNIPFGTTDWSQITPTEHKGETGTAWWRTQQFDSLRVRMVEYSPGYLADHWCKKGHILLCLEGNSIPNWPMEGSLSSLQEKATRFLIMPNRIVLTHPAGRSSS